MEAVPLLRYRLPRSPCDGAQGFPHLVQRELALLRVHLSAHVGALARGFFEFALQQAVGTARTFPGDVSSSESPGPRSSSRQ